MGPSEVIFLNNLTDFSFSFYRFVSDYSLSDGSERGVRRLDADGSSDGGSTSFESSEEDSSASEDEDDRDIRKNGHGILVKFLRNLCCVLLFYQNTKILFH